MVTFNQQFTLTEGGRTIVPNIYISVLAHSAKAKVQIYKCIIGTDASGNKKWIT